MFYQGWKVYFPRRRTSHPISLDGGWESAANKKVLGPWECAHRILAFGILLFSPKSGDPSVGLQIAQILKRIA